MSFANAEDALKAKAAQITKAITTVKFSFFIRNPSIFSALTKAYFILNYIVWHLKKPNQTKKSLPLFFFSPPSLETNAI
jgi:hypothetical protein